MKNTLLALLFSSISLITYSQIFNPNQYQLKAYKAPEIKYQSLGIGLRSGGQGLQEGSQKSNNGSGNLYLKYYQYKNLTNFQGAMRIGISSNISIANQKTSNYSDKHNRFEQLINCTGTNRFYRRDFFIGIHPSVIYGYSNSSIEVDLINGNGRHQVSNNMGFNAVISVGKGRIEPITAAREALDILISLKKYNRLAKAPSNEEIDILAKRINEIKFKRFFDFRFKRIYQLEEIDSVLQNMGIVQNPDMVYAANLNDIWNYGTTGQRGSGSRLELGIIPMINRMESNQVSRNKNSSNLNNRIGMYFMMNWSKLVPLNYKWQSNVLVDGVAGVTSEEVISKEITDSLKVTEYSAQKMSVRWILGFFPNTRTYISMSPNAMLSFNQSILDSGMENSEGMRLGVDMDAYYYFSPQLRLSLNTGVSYRSNEYVELTPEYTTRINAIDQVDYPRNSKYRYNGLNTFYLGYTFNLMLAYAIF